jgi:hypothetical protein
MYIFEMSLHKMFVFLSQIRKMNLKSLLSIILMTGSLASLNAQQRKCELAISLLSPSQSAVIQAYAQYTLTVRVLNNGPADLLAGDTLWYNIPSLPLISYSTYILQQPIGAGTAADITLATLNNVNTNTDDETVDYYATVVSMPNGTGAFKDTMLSNNTATNQITFKPCDPGGTAVHNVEAKSLNIAVFPNPASGLLQVKTNDLNITNLVVADLSGRVVLSKSNLNNNSANLDIASLIPVMYFLKMETAKGTATAKFIKQ